MIRNEFAMFGIAFLVFSLLAAVGWGMLPAGTFGSTDQHEEQIRITGAECGDKACTVNISADTTGRALYVRSTTDLQPDNDDVDTHLNHIVRAHATTDFSASAGYEGDVDVVAFGAPTFLGGEDIVAAWDIKKSGTVERLDPEKAADAVENR